MDDNDDDDVEMHPADETEHLGKYLKNPFKKFRPCGASGDISPPEWSSSDEYDFSHAQRGLAVIIVNDKFKGQNQRDGSDLDKQNLQGLFHKLGFIIRTYYDNTSKELMTELKNVAKEDHSGYDCFVLAISTHGDEYFGQGGLHRQDFIFTTDSVIRTRDILDMFRDKKCPTLKGKPRLVFLQACRGMKLDDGQRVICVKSKPEFPEGEDVPDMGQGTGVYTQTSDATDARPKSKGCHKKATPRQLVSQSTQTSPGDTGATTSSHQVSRGGRIVRQADMLTPQVVTPAPCYKDFLVMYATPPGYYAFRRPGLGSWFIHCLYKVLLKSDGSRSLTQELTRVIGMVARDLVASSPDNPLLNEKKQSPVIYSMLTKDIYLRPKGMDLSS